MSVDIPSGLVSWLVVGGQAALGLGLVLNASRLSFSLRATRANK